MADEQPVADAGASVNIKPIEPIQPVQVTQVGTQPAYSQPRQQSSWTLTQDMIQRLISILQDLKNSNPDLYDYIANAMTEAASQYTDPEEQTKASYVAAHKILKKYKHQQSGKYSGVMANATIGSDGNARRAVGIGHETIFERRSERINAYQNKVVPGIVTRQSPTILTSRSNVSRNTNTLVSTKKFPTSKKRVVL